MNAVSFVRGFAVLALAMASQLQAEQGPAATFDLSRDFSLVDNPNGAWSYGYKTGLDGTFAPNRIRQAGITPEGVPLDLWGFQPNTLPAVYFNASSQTGVTHGGQGTYPPGTVFFLAGHDGTEQDFGAIRLVIPAGEDGEYRLESAVRTYLNGPESGDADYHIVKNGVEVFGQFMSPSSSSGYSNSLTLAAGDTIDFLVGRGQDGVLYGSGLVIDARLYLLTSHPSPARILVQPRSKTIFAGANVSFAVEATGTAPLEYQWRFDGETISGATNASLMLGNVAITQAGSYSVVVSNALGTAVSSNAVLTVNTPPTPGTFDLSRDFSLVDNPNGVWSYGYKTALDGTFAPILVRQAGITPEGVPLDLWGFQPNTLPAVYFNATSQTGVTHGGQGTYPPGTVFFLAGHDGTEQNFGAIRLVIPAGGDGEYRLESAVRTYLNGPASGDADYHVVKNGVELFGQFMSPSSSSGYSNSLTLAAGDTIDFLVGRGQDGVLYSSGLVIDARLYLLTSHPSPARILVQPRSRTIFAGANVSFAVEATGTAPLEYQWRFDGEVISGATNASLMLANVALTQAGSYSVVVSNALGGAVSSNAVLTVNVPPTPGTFDLSRDFSLVDNPNGVWSYGYKTGLDGTFAPNRIRQAGITPEGVPLDLWGFQPNTLPAVYFNASSQTGVTHGGQGTYPPGTVFFLAGHDGTEQNFGAIRLVIPAGGDGEYRLESAVRTYLNGPASGDADYHVVKNGIELFGQFMSPSSSSGYSNSLSLVAGDTLDFLVGRGEDGQLYSSGLVIDARLFFQGGTSAPPSILVQPRSREVVVGTDLTLSVVANGTAPLHFQWQKSNADLTDATNTTLVLNSVASTDAGGYSVVVENDFGSVTSLVATVVVNPGPAILRIVSATAGTEGEVQIPIEMVGNGNENAIGFSLRFDPAILHWVGAVAGTSAQDASLLVNSDQSGSGRVGIALGLPSGTAFPGGTQQLVRITLAVVQTTNRIDSSIRFGDQPVPRQVEDAQAHGLNASFVDGGVLIDGTGTTNGVGFEGDIIPRPSGNGVLGINDWVQLGRFVAGLDAITNQQEFQRTDCAPRSTRGDGIVTASDWVQAGRYAIGLDLLGPTGGPSEPQAPGGFAPAGGPPTARRLSFPATAALPGSTLAVPIRFESQGNENALSFSVSFDPTKLQLLGVGKLSKAFTALLNVNTNQANAGKVGLALALPAGTAMAANGDNFITLNFAVRAEATGIVPITFGSQPVLREVSDITANPVPNLYSDGAVTIGNPLTGPAISIFQSGGNVILAWPSSAVGFELHSSVNMTVGSWSKVSVTPIEIGGQKLVSLPISGYQRYFRLVQP